MNFTKAHSVSFKTVALMDMDNSVGMEEGGERVWAEVEEGIEGLNGDGKIK